jgi:hypothetical protein
VLVRDAVFAQLLNVSIVCIVHYPLFACATYGQHIVANAAGFVYAIPL